MELDCADEVADELLDPEQAANSVVDSAAAKMIAMILFFPIEAPPQHPSFDFFELGDMMLCEAEKYLWQFAEGR